MFLGNRNNGHSATSNQAAKSARSGTKIFDIHILTATFTVNS